MNAIKPKIENYPAPTGPYKVDVLGGCDWRLSRRLRIGISLGSKYHEGDRFYALLEWAAARFETVDILVADSVHRHNIMFQRNVDEQTAYVLSLAEGDDWIARNGSVISQVLGKYRIHRFDDVKREGRFEPTHRYLQSLHKADEEFWAIVERDIKGMWARKMKNGDFSSDTSFDEFAKHSRNYILEELAAMNCLDDVCPGIDAYPGKFLSVLSSPDRFAIQGLPPRLLHYPLVEIGFVRNKGYKMAVTG